MTVRSPIEFTVEELMPGYITSMSAPARHEAGGDVALSLHAFRPVTRYWDRITRPSQLIASLPQALAVMLDPAECGPVFLALPQDVQAEAYDYPEKFFERQVRVARRPHPDPAEIRRAATAIRAAKRLFAVAADADPATILMEESVEQAALIGSPNQIEAVMSAMQKRPGVFTDV